MRNSLKISTIALALVAMLAGSNALYAGPQRMGALGMDGTSYWMLGTDTTTTAYFPSYATRFPGLMAIQPGDAVPNGIIFLKFLDNNLAVWIKGGGTTAQYSGLSTPYESAIGDIDSSGEGGTTTPDGMTLSDNILFNYAFVLAYKMGNMAFGLSIGYGDASYSDTDATYGAVSQKQDYSKSDIAFHLGFDMDLGGMGVDVGLQYVMMDWSGSTSNVTGLSTSEKYESTPSIMSIFGRFNMALNEVMTLHAFLNYAMTSADDKVTMTTAPNTTVMEGTMSINSLSIGVSDELKFGKGAFSYVGLLYNTKTTEASGVAKLNGVAGDKDTNTVTVNTLTARIGTQAQLTQNLTGLVGVYRTWDYSETDETKTDLAAGGSETDTTETVTGSKLPTGTWGLIYTMGHFKIEFNMTAALLRQGPNFLSGASGDMASSVNVVYVFGNPGKFEEDKK